MESINVVYKTELNSIEEVDTAEGKVKITDKHVIICRIDAKDPFNTMQEDYFTVGVKMTAVRRVFEEASVQKISVRSIPEIFGHYYKLSKTATMQDMHEAIESNINLCIEEIKKMYGQPKEA